ncbi:anthrax toxin lethal factor-related metalloendopeptidase [Heyndrickxia oleronia]|uniref:anthrax toxin lethal factor-related metalloendopeptidase n=1 Tax=Heyndrickxia oleronia TaxID=38875 RepID=UPI001B0F68A4|nr:toxin [Heyndrickxia oleronia]GIN40379.1 Pro-Pro endopeptidase [Heyndrickxia oleronia]
MGKYLMISLLIFSLVLLQGNSKPDIDGILLKNSKLFQTLSLKSGKQLKNIIILPNHKNYNYGEVKKIISRLDHLPSSMLNRAMLAGIKVKLFDGKLTDNPSAAFLKGITPRGYQDRSITWDKVPGIGGSQIVLVKIGSSEQGMGHGSVNLELHEMAHSLERFLYSSNDKKRNFKYIWKEEAPLLFPHTQYFLTYPEEYFAETFAMYYYNKVTKNELRRLAPSTYTYISLLQ